MLGPTSTSSPLPPPSPPLSSAASASSFPASSAPLLLRRFALPSLAGWSSSASPAPAPSAPPPTPPVPPGHLHLHLHHAPSSSAALSLPSVPPPSALTRLSPFTFAWLAAACLALNLLVSLWIIGHIDREKHPTAPLTTAPTALRPLVATEGGEPSAPRACPLTFPLTSCAPPSTADGTPAPISLSAMQAELLSSLAQLQTLRSALSQSPSADAASTVNSSSFSLPSSPSALPFLYVGIPTVARSSPSASWYLNASLHSILAQLPVDPLHPLYQQVQVLVMNHSPPHTPHTAFEDARRELSASPSSPFHFLTNPGLLADATPELRDAGSANLPGWKVRKQTRDIVATLRAAQGRSRYYLFMEDDFTWCPHTLQLLTYMVDKGRRYHPRPFSYKVSFGMNGFMVANDEDLQHFAQYLLDHQRLRPPDHILTEWSAGEKESAAYKQGRPHMVYRYNLLHHLGSISSLREERNAEYPACWHEMNTEVVFEVESFRRAECDHDDLWPCWGMEQVRQAKDERSHSSRWLEPFNIPDTWITEAQKK